MRNLLYLWILLCGPGALFVLGWGLKLIYREAGLGVLMLCSAVIVTAGLGLASLLDTRRPLPNPPRRDQ